MQDRIEKNIWYTNNIKAIEHLLSSSVSLRDKAFILGQALKAKDISLSWHTFNKLGKLLNGIDDDVLVANCKSPLLSTLFSWTGQHGHVGYILKNNDHANKFTTTVEAIHKVKPHTILPTDYTAAFNKNNIRFCDFNTLVLFQPNVDLINKLNNILRNYNYVNNILVLFRLEPMTDKLIFDGGTKKYLLNNHIDNGSIFAYDQLIDLFHQLIAVPYKVKIKQIVLANKPYLVLSATYNEV